MSRSLFGLDRDSVPILSIAIPLYNNRSTVLRAVQSCLNQSCLDNCEIIVVDNASTDGSYELVSDCASSNPGTIALVRNPETVSMYANHNLCLQHVRGAYVLFLHADDWLDPLACEYIIRKLRQRHFSSRYILWGHSMYSDFMYRLLECGFSLDTMFAGQFAFSPFLTGGLSPSGVCYSIDILDYGGFLPTSHPVAASDSSSMIFWALKGFRFEMCTNIYAFRSQAGTAKSSLPFRVYREAYYDAWDSMINSLSELEKQSLLTISASPKHSPPMLFLSYLSLSLPLLALRKLLAILAHRPIYFFHSESWRVLISPAYYLLRRLKPRALLS